MAIGGVVEIFLGVDAEQQSLEDLAQPLSATGILRLTFRR